MPVSVGIDLGTTFSAVAAVNPQTGMPEIVLNGEGGKITPSIIQFINGTPVFGSEAASAFAAGELDCVAAFKRSMGKNETYCTVDGIPYTAEQLSTLLLKHLKAGAEATLGDTIQEAVITVPAYFRSPEREATIMSAEAAGLTVKQLIDEPNAASLAYGLNHWRENANILVYDLGGGTFDVSLVCMGENGKLSTVSTQGNHYLGGKDWDARLEGLLFAKFADETEIDLEDLEEDISLKAALRGLAENVKKQLTTMMTAKASEHIPGYGNATVTLTREEFEQNTSDLLDQTGALCRAVLSEVGITKEDVTDVLLVGGSTRMPQVTSFILGLFGKKPIAHVNPDEAVALGAAIQATKKVRAYIPSAIGTLDGKKVAKTAEVSRKKAKDSFRLGNIGLLDIQETTAHAMGMIAINQDETRYINDIIIPANHARPTRVAKAFTFYTTARGDQEMDIFVLQGENENPLDNLITNRYVISGIRHNREQKGKTIIRVQYSYDNNGIICVSARQNNDNTNLPVRKDVVPEDMSKYGLPYEKQEFKIEPLSVVLAVDVSGSMYANDRAPLRDAQRAMRDFVDKILDDVNARVAIVAVADSAEVVCGLTNDDQRCHRAIETVDAIDVGGANAGHPFDAIKNMLQHEAGNRYAIVLADGMWQCQSAAIAASESCNAVGIETAAIGFGSADHAFLRSISSDDANALLVSQSELSQAFGSIAQSLGGAGGPQGQSGGATDVATWDD